MIQCVIRTLQLKFKRIQWRIQDFPQGKGAPTSMVGVKGYYLANF